MILILISGCAKVSVQTPETSVMPASAADGIASSAADLSVVSATAQTQTAPGTTIAAQQQTQQSSAASASVSVTRDQAQPSSVAAAHQPAPLSTGAPATQASQTPWTAAQQKQTEANTAPPATEKQTTAPAAPEPTISAQFICTVRIECKTIQDNLKKLKAGKSAFVPTSGVILADTEVALQDGDTAFTVLQRACKEHVCTDNCKYCQAAGIQLEYTYTPGFDTYYVEGIHQIYEKDCGTMSGWMFSVNNDFPDVGASSLEVHPGDRIVFCYTCDMGDDVGNHFTG